MITLVAVCWTKIDLSEEKALDVGPKAIQKN